MIPRSLHQIWVGPDPGPVALMATWTRAHPAWTYRLWTMDDYDARPWRAKAQMAAFASRGCWEGVADIMRYEILFHYGGFYLDADLDCVRPLDDWLCDCELLAVRESEIHRRGVIANGIIGAIPWQSVFWRCLDKICALTPTFLADPHVWAFQTTGPTLWTAMLKEARNALIVPSVLFLPQHYVDEAERDSSLIYARHAWTGTRRHLAAQTAVLA